MPPESEAQAWWADIQHVRESIERRRAHAAGASVGKDAEPRFTRAPADSLPQLDDLDWTSASPVYSGVHVDHTGRGKRAERSPARPRRPAESDGGERSDSAAVRHVVVDRRDPARSHESGGERREGSDRTGIAREPAHGDLALDAGVRHTGVSHAEPAAPRIPDNATAATGGATGRAADTRAATPVAQTPLAPPPPRRTVQITGRTVGAPPIPRLVEVERRRPARRPVERVGPRPDRIAMWAVLLGFFLILVAATSSRAAAPSEPTTTSAAVALHAPAR